MIKKAIKLVSYSLAFLGLGSVQSCDDDPSGELCYRCTWQETYGDETYDYQSTICFDDAKTYLGEDLTKDEFIEYMEDFENEMDADCKKKELI